MSSSSSLTVEVVATKPFAGQKPGTSGLRKKVVEFEHPHYLENFVQAIFNALPPNELTGSTLVVAGDGRYYNTHAIQVIIRMCAAAGVAKVLSAVGGLMSTPCVSAAIRARKAYGGIILTASHNPGGPKEDFGIKYNISNGGPAPESVTDVIFEQTKKLSHYKIVKEIPTVVDLNKEGIYSFGNLQVEIFNAPKFYADFLKSIFDFPALTKFLARRDFSFLYDSMNGVAGPFAQQVFVKELGAKPESLLRAIPKEDFGGGHPDPNLTYAHELVQALGIETAAEPHGDASTSSSSSSSSHQHHEHHHIGHGGGHAVPDFGAAADGDADRNMILGKKFFVTPSDSLAIITAYAQKAIPYFKNGVKGVARSMPTSAAVDRVASKLGLHCYEVPTGWKFFGNLMDANQLSICGEESFGTGSDHIREKDGLWAVLCWLSILEFVNRQQSEGHLLSVQHIVQEHWKTYGRNYYSRYDYENVDSEAANKMMAHLLQVIQNSRPNSTKFGTFTLSAADEFTYTDPVDKSVSPHQGIRFHFTDGSRVVYRLSGTGSVGATIRVYIEKYENDANKLATETAAALEPLIKVALEISHIQQFTGREKPTVIT